MTRLVHRLGGLAPSLLRTLVVFSCSSLTQLPLDLYCLNSLETLCICECPNLHFIPDPVGSSGGGQQQLLLLQLGFTSLRQLHISNCEGLITLPVEMVESCLLSLEELRLQGLSSILNMGMVIGCLHKITRLGKLEIIEVPEFIIHGSLSTNNSLQSLQMGPFSPYSWNINVSFNETVDAMLRRFISLRGLILYGMEHSDYLPVQLQHLTSLEELSLQVYGIESLPEWFGNLSSSLKTLRLIDCKKLRHLPSKQAMQCLSKLTLLDIKRCPLLLKVVSNNNPQIVDSELPKIYHILIIKVDGHQVSSGH